MSKPLLNIARKGRPIQRKDRVGYMIKVRITPPFGTTKTISVYGRTLSEVEGRADDMMRWYSQYASIEAAEAALQQTVAMVATAYIAERPLAPKSVAHYEWLIRPEGPVAPLLHQRVADLTTDSLNEWARHMKRAGYSVSLQRRTIKFIRSVLRAAKLDGMLPNVRLDLVALPAETETIMRYWLPEEAHQFLAAVDALPEAVAFLLMLGMGLRVGEVRGLTWRDLDLKRGVLHVRQQITDVNGIPTVTTPKSKRSRRTLPIPAEFNRRLARHLAEVSFEKSKVRPTDQVVVTKTGKAYGRERLARVLTRVSKAEGLQEIHIHGLRHTYAALMRHHGTDIATLSRLMGHSDLRVTERFYGHMYDEDLRRANEPMGRLLHWEESDDES